MFVVYKSNISIIVAIKWICKEVIPIYSLKQSYEIILWNSYYEHYSNTIGLRFWIFDYIYNAILHSVILQFAN